MAGSKKSPRTDGGTELRTCTGLFDDLVQTDADITSDARNVTEWVCFSSPGQGGLHGFHFGEMDLPNFQNLATKYQ